MEERCCLCQPAEERGWEGFRQRSYQIAVSIRHAGDRGALPPKLYYLCTGQCYLDCDGVGS